ncbi:HD domain-containing phosphohydrolase [Ruminococcus sp. HUN007]|uniref:HD domain-containing phosphohydrolase n=1 Tax=Ruminococcus sp. HUN007 TaxID=1514668 RepID=UPI000679E842|nr:HD domain-containing phosphohydrolase [Ruminococcus sp. HUN007]
MGKITTDLKRFAVFCVSSVTALALLYTPAGGVSCISKEVYAGEFSRVIDEESLAVDPTGKGDGYLAVLYDNKNGLPTSEANAVLQTSDGFIWIGCYSGLIRYDGCNFERIKASTGVTSVVSLFEDSQKRLWVGTNDSGAAVMENGEFRVYRHSDGMKSLSVRSVAEDNAGNVWLGTTRGLSFVDPEGDLHNFESEDLVNEYIRKIRSCDDGSICGLTMSGSVFTIKGGKLTGFYTSDDLGISDIHAVLPDSDRPGFYYIGNKGSALYYGRLQKGFKSEKMIMLNPLEYVNSIEKVGDMIWICSDTGIGFLNDGRFVPVKNTPMNTSVENMAVDYQKNLWFASSKQGIMKIVPNQFLDIFEKYGLPDDVVESDCVYDDKLWIAGKTEGLKVLSTDGLVDSIPVESSVSSSGSRFRDGDLITLLKDKRIRSIYKDSSDRLWFSTFSHLGLVCYDHGKVTRYTVEDGMPSERVRTVYECSDGSVIAACTGGIAVIRDGKIEKVYSKDDGIDNTEILTVVCAENGDIILGTDGGGIYIIGGDSNIKHLTVEKGELSSDVVMRIKKDRKRNLYWVVTSNSLSCMDASYRVRTISNFPYPNNFDIFQNSSDEMWILSSNGIYVSETEEILKNEEIQYLHYGMDNGLSCTATSNSYSCLTPRGMLYIAGTNGVAAVNIEKSFENVSDIKVSVPYVEVDGSYIFPDENGNYVIPSSSVKLTVYSYVYNYSLMNPDVTYYLKGFEHNPVTVKRSELTPASYTNLRGGEYTFVMKVDDPQGDSTKETVIKIIKEKKWYEKIVVHIIALVLILALLAALLKAYISYRTRKYEEKNRQQKELIREIVESFAKVIDMKDSYTNGHSTRVAEYTAMLSKELGCDEDTVEKYYNIALLHDIGKIGIPPEVLNKPGKLTDTEFNIIKSHSALGYEALKNISIMPELSVGAGMHHERPDGKGYPKGLKGDQILRVAQIIAVADTFDAMYSDRPYRKRMNFEKAVSIMKEVSGTQLASDVVDAFLRLVEKGEFRAENDNGGGTMEDIDNIHRKQK